jgi:P4 family phage/plasmid primase-like protien
MSFKTKKLFFENYQENVTNPNYVATSKGRWEIKNNEGALTQYFYLSIAKNYNWKCICAKTDKADSHRLWFDCDSSKDSTENILHNINMILVENLIEPNTRSLITMNIGNNHKRHIKYPDIYVNNSIRKALVEKINEKFGDGYVDDNANCGLRLELTNKYDKDKGDFVENTRYVKENGEDLTIEELTGDYNILKEGEIIGIKKGLVKEVQKKQKTSSSKSINMKDLPQWVKLQYETINNDDRFKNKIQDISVIRNNLYILNLKQGSFQCPFVKKVHSSNRNKIHIYPNSKKSYLTCHKCCGKKEYLNLNFNQCLIDDDDIDIEIDLNKNKLTEFFYLHNQEIKNTMINGGELQYAKLCKKFYYNDIKCVKPSKERFYVWNDRIQLWEEDRKGCRTKVKISQFLCDIVGKLIEECETKINAATDLMIKEDLIEEKKDCRKLFKNVASHKSMNCVMKTFTSLVYNDTFEQNLNKNRKILSIKDGVIDLQKGTFRKRTRADMLSYRLERDYETPDLSDLGNLGNFLNESFKDKGSEREELIEWLQKFLGYCLSGEVKEQIFCIWLGQRGGNGKSLICSLMAEIMEKLYTNLSISDVCKGNRSDSEKKLFGKCIDKRTGVFEEPDQNDRLKESIIKSLCGMSDTTVVNAKKLYKDEMDCYMYITPILNTNYQINADPEDDAFWRRVQVVPFDRYFRSTDDDDYQEDDELCGIRDDDLLVKIQQEDLFFYWVVEGAKKYYDTGLKKIPECMKNAKRRCRNINDPLGDFINDYVIEDSEANNSSLISKSEFHMRYMKEHGKIDINTLGKKMIKKGYKEKKVKRSFKTEFGTQRKTVRLWDNLIWDDEAVCLVEDDDKVVI